MIRFNYPYYPLQWYKNGNPVSGNAGQFNYKTLRQGDELRAWWWLGPWCLEKTEHVETTVFPYGQETLEMEVYITQGEDSVRIDTSAEAGKKNRWSGLSIECTAMEPKRRP